MYTNNAKNKIRDRFQEIRDKIDVADDRADNALDVLKEAKRKADELELDRDSCKRKIELTKASLAERNNELKKKLKKLEDLEDKDKVESELVKTLENIELDGDEKLNSLEKQLQKISNIADKKESENKESTLRLEQLESELEKVFRREGDALEKAEKLQECIQLARSQMDGLKEREEGAYEREDESEKKLTFLTQELHTKASEAEEKERQVNNLTLYRDKIKAEIQEERKKIQKTQAEIDSLDDLTDDF